MVRVRFAPSPTGIPHVGNIRTALFDYFLAKANNGKFILRIEDTDQARIVKGAEEAIKESLSWLGAEWDDFIVQSKRLSEYKKYAKKLVEDGLAIEEKEAIRFIVPKTIEKVSWIDAIGNKEISYEGENIEDFIILKADGFPTYHLANVVDDHLMEISHVIRGEDWISSTPKHLLLYKAFGWKPPVFAHVPNVLGTDGKKLSKRKGAKSVLDFKKEGYLQEALLNYLMLLGWSPKDNREVLTKEEIITEFSLDKINSSPAVFDLTKLAWLNGVWIRKLAKEDLNNRLLEFYNDDPETLKFLKSQKADKMIDAASSRMKTLNDFKNLISAQAPRKKTKEEENIADKLLKYLEKELEDDKWEDEKFLAALKNFSKNTEVPFKKIYFLLTKKEQGIGLLELNQIYGKDFFIQNLSDE